MAGTSKPERTPEEIAADWSSIDRSLMAETSGLLCEMVAWMGEKLIDGTRPVPLHSALMLAASLASGSGPDAERFYAVVRERKRSGQGEA